MQRVLVLWVLGFFAACGPAAPTAVDVGPDTDGPATASSTLTAANDEGIWFPLVAGNRWVFEAAGSSRTVSLTAVNGTIARLEGLFDAPHWVASAPGAPNTLFLWNESIRRWEPLVRFGFATTSWSLGSGCTGLMLHREATGLVVSGTAGTFSDTRTVAAALPDSAGTGCPALAFSELTFAANLGLVGFRSGTGERFVLASAVVGGTLWPLTTGSVQGAVALDQPRYVNVPDTVPCPVGPCPTNAQTASAAVTFTVTNGTDRSLTWRFGTACQFDVDVASVTGEVVRRLSDGRFCTQAPTELTLGAGESKAFDAELTLTDRDGVQLDGEFTLSARLLGPDGPTPTASLPLTVTIR